jgi:hypothetical protein
MKLHWRWPKRRIWTTLGSGTRGGRGSSLSSCSEIGPAGEFGAEPSSALAASDLVGTEALPALAGADGMTALIEAPQMLQRRRK